MMESYTDLEQSKKLAEILPIESADMCYKCFGEETYDLTFCEVSYSEWAKEYKELYDKAGIQAIPCWSLAALLSVLPKEIEIDGQHYAPCLFPVQDKWLLKLWYNSNYTITSPIAIFSDNPIDACVELILKLNELNLL